MTPVFNAVTLVVQDMAASLAFYRALGLDIPASADTQPHAEAALPGGLRLLWDTRSVVTGIDPSWTPPTGSAQTGLAFACQHPAEVDRVYAELTAAGHHGHLPPWDAFWGQRYAVLHDPDGNGVDLYAPLKDPTS